MISAEKLTALITLAERQTVELDAAGRTLAEIEMDGDLPKEIGDARVARGLMEVANA